MNFPNWTIRNADDWQRFAVWFGEHTDPYPFRVCPGEGRSLSQNALLHLWIGEIASQRGDVSADTVKGELHRRIGLDIRLRNSKFAFVWGSLGAGNWAYEQQCGFLASGILNVSSGMTTGELKEYLDAIEGLAAENGWRLTQPKERV